MQAASNVQKMREILCKCAKYLEMVRQNGYSDCIELQQEVDAALALPTRQCDVGTAEEQERRRIEFCRNHSCIICPLRDSENNGVSCDITWAQVPYEEGGAE